MAGRSTEKIGILGGTFNPVHFGHLALAQEAWYRYELSRVLFIPAAQNPLREDSPRDFATDHQRMEMLKIACEGDTRFAVDALEMRRGGKSYTIDTLSRLSELHKGAELFLIMGSDSAHTLSDWKEVGKYGELCLVVLAERPGSRKLEESVLDNLHKLGIRFEIMPMPPLDISSTEIRKRLRQGKPIRYFLPNTVIEYIHLNKVYSI